MRHVLLGTALVLGPNINAPMDSASGVKAYAAVRKALAASGANERERALIRALAKRYAAVPPADRAALDSAYACAMGDVARRYPADLEAATLYAEALMELSPWNYWTKQGEPRPNTREMLTQLERVLARDQSHPGACHFYIHAVEAAYPERAIGCAERLAAPMPGAGHIVHMPAHIYIRVGRWNEAIESNRHAVHTDETYIADQRPEGIYPIGYYPHNYHFLAFAATMAGRGDEAVRAARSAAQKTPVDVVRQVPELQGLLPYAHLALVTFGRWDEVLREPLPPADVPIAGGLCRGTLSGGDAPGGWAAVHGAAVLVLPDPALAGGGATENRPRRGSRNRLPRGPEALPREWLVAVRSRPESARAEEGG